MQLRDILERFPETVRLFTSQSAFYRVLHYSIVDDRRAGLRPRGHSYHDGTGVPIHYTTEHVRVIALRRLLSAALAIDGVSLPRTINPALAAATFDHDQQTAMIVADGCVISLVIPDNLWHELVVSATQGAPHHA